MDNNNNNDKRKKLSLGRGLGALIPGMKNTEEADLGAVFAERDSFNCEINLISPSKFQPRRNFNDEEIEALSASIKEQGIIQPLVVRKQGAGFELIAGERRLRAAKMAGLEKVPVLVKNVGDNAVLEMALVENIQREDLNALEEAYAINQLIDTFGLTQEEAAQRLGRSRSAVANTLRLLGLPTEVKRDVTQGKLSAGHARALLGLDNAQTQVLLARKIIEQQLSVRQTEEMVRKMKNTPAAAKAKPLKSRNQLHYESLVSDLASRWGTKIAINQSGKKGKLVIEYYSEDDLSRLIERLQSLQA